MRIGAKANHVRRLRETAEELMAEAKIVENAPDEPLRWSVGWGPKWIKLAEREVSAAEAENIVTDGIWAMFESCRDGADARDPKAFERVMRRIEELARDRCHQERRPETATSEEKKR